MLSTYIDHPRAHLLDGLIEDATRYDPGMRPDMNTFAAELEAWLAPPGPEAVGPDVSDLGQRIVSIIEREQLQQQEAHRPLIRATALNQRFFEQVAVVGKELRDAGFPVQEVATTTLWDIFGKGRLTGHGRLVYGGAYMYLVEHGPGSPRLLTGVGVELYDDGHLQLAAAHIVVPFGSVVGAEITWVGTRDMPLSAHAVQDCAVDDLANELLSSLRPSAARFVELFEGRTPMADGM
jgi:hypothetical protein